MQINHTRNGVIALCQDTPTTLARDWFSVDYWRAKNAVVGSSKGRYTTWFVQADAQAERPHWVLRHYWRGGLMEKISRDAYFYTGLSNTRAMAELALLDILYREGFSVPKPIAANIERHGLCYRADIIIERVAGAEDLVARLSKTQMSDSEWQRLGAKLAQFHRRGVYHADLNAKNILITATDFYLIDFDRGELRSPSKGWQRANLQRLLRSFNKEKSKCPALAFTEANWQLLLAGYNSALAD
ncbi:3-deoxy-D-manno-octulosonic acid kinase [Shewanella salipaludis]|uniref:3-deoxy-D-manno-octulosonic acid kinase n=1 Tax=Shewanella salipaludis TaxID=2723052 RepID=A0A972JMN6_9GAMM|nr:3-deoxy-D-manno-octulosonic acid kinase [Shewanella salipaludis]NMH66697.1 3-deoxy-D-manno-octulosonic acid kinase [Shewanella salipaludis]